MNDFQKRLEEFRTFYFVKYGQKLDDEVLYFFIRINEMQTDLKKQLLQLNKDIKKHRIAFRTGWDYFLYGFGAVIGIGFCAAIALALSFVLLHIFRNHTR